MRQQRWFGIAVLAVVLFAINLVARLVTRLAFAGDDAAENRASIAMFTVIGLTLAAAAFVRSQQQAPARWLPDVAGAAILGMLLTVLVGPFVSGDTPFSGGAGNFFSQVWLYGGFSIVGVLFGYWVATALGRDHRSRLLRALAETRTARPRRVVRR